jgi:zinc protease
VPSAPAPGLPRRARDLMERPAQQAQVMVGYIVPGLSDADYASVRVMGMLLGGGMSGRLFTELRDRRGLAYQVGVLGSYRTGPSFLLAYMGTAPANVEASEKGVLAEIERIRTEPVTDRELARAKAYLLGNLTMDRRTTARDAWYLAFFEVTGAGWSFPERYARAVEAVTTADVGRVARQYLTGPTVVVLQPPPKGVGP